MNTALEEATRDTPHDDAPKMIHLTDPPYTHSLCGVPLSNHYVRDGSTPVDCIVCAGLDSA